MSKLIRMLPAGAFLVVVLTGCSQSTDKAGAAKADRKGEQVASAKKAHDHSGWWCDEHGIPEEECSMCSARVAAEGKKKGDWCELHDRAKSQCFICDPSLKERFAAKYRAKYDKEPPPIEEETAKSEKKS